MPSIPSFLKVDLSTKEGRSKLIKIIAAIVVVIAIIVVVIVVIRTRRNEDFTTTIDPIERIGIGKVKAYNSGIISKVNKNLDNDHTKAFYKKVGADEAISQGRGIRSIFGNLMSATIIKQYYEEELAAQEAGQAAKVSQTQSGPLKTSVQRALQTQALKNLQSKQAQAQVSQPTQVKQGQVSQPTQSKQAQVPQVVRQVGAKPEFVKIPTQQAQRMVKILSGELADSEILEPVNSPLGKGVELALPKKVSQSVENPNTAAVNQSQSTQQTLATHVKQLSETQKQQNAEAFRREFGSYAVDDFEDYGLH